MIGTSLGHFQITARLGAGGMGEVYRARDTRLGRDVAIKVLPAEFAADPERLRRFEQEARATAALDHPNILAIHEIGSHEGRPYLVEELLEGESLRDRLQGGSLSPRKVVELAVQVCSGLAAAHEKGIVHRDLKPENVFVTKDGVVKILDFGLARLKEPDTGDQPQRASAALTETRPGVVLGTAAYMSPEQVRGQGLDHRTDIFSLGVVLYEMLSGQQPFARDTAADTVSAILSRDPPPLPAREREMPAALPGIVSQCLEKRPEDRFSSRARRGAGAAASLGAGGGDPAAEGRRDAGEVVAAGRRRCGGGGSRRRRARWLEAALPRSRSATRSGTGASGQGRRPAVREPRVARGRLLRRGDGRGDHQSARERAGPGRDLPHLGVRVRPEGQVRQADRQRPRRRLRARGQRALGARRGTREPGAHHPAAHPGRRRHPRLVRPLRASARGRLRHAVGGGGERGGGDGRDAPAAGTDRAGGGLDGRPRGLRPLPPREGAERPRLGQEGHRGCPADVPGGGRSRPPLCAGPRRSRRGEPDDVLGVLRPEPGAPRQEPRTRPSGPSSSAPTWRNPTALSAPTTTVACSTTRRPWTSSRRPSRSSPAAARRSQGWAGSCAARDGGWRRRRGSRRPRTWTRRTRIGPSTSASPASSRVATPTRIVPLRARSVLNPQWAEVYAERSWVQLLWRGDGERAQAHPERGLAGGRAHGRCRLPCRSPVLGGAGSA